MRGVQGSGLSWLFPFENGQPPIGWHDAGAYLILPLLLVASQYASQKLVTPQSNDPAQQQTQAILGFLPFMIGEQQHTAARTHSSRAAEQGTAFLH